MDTLYMHISLTCIWNEMPFTFLSHPFLYHLAFSQHFAIKTQEQDRPTWAFKNHDAKKRACFYTMERRGDEKAG